MKTKIKFLVMLLCVCGLFAFSSAKANKNVDDAKIWGGIGYLAARSPAASPEVGLAISIVGTWESAIWGAGFALACGGPVGICVGLGVGL
ncbi:MAG: hypothetical protein LBB84_12860 [Tannerellaceae bacterium]|jgi:hypothetical protein|nr:hypothetical protein [Tannerellaceae bacterium]